MRRLLLYLALVFSCALTLAQTPHTQLTGTLNNPDGSGFNGNLYLSISQSSAVTATSPCGGPAQVVPGQSLNIKISNGQMASYTVAGSSNVINGAPKIFGSDCTIPQGVPYNAVLKDLQGNTLYNTQWLIVGATQDIGAVYELQTPVTTAVVLTTGYGQPTGACAANTAYLQVDAAQGSNMWSCVNGTWLQQTGTPGTVAIGSPVNGVNPASVLYGSTAGKLAQDTTFVYDPIAHKLTAQNLAVTNPIQGNLNGNANTSTKLVSAGSSCTYPNVAKGVDASGNAMCVAPPPPSGAAGGDLIQNFPAPLVSGIQGYPVDNSAPINNAVLVFDSATGKYIPQQLDASQIIGGIGTGVTPVGEVPSGSLNGTNTVFTLSQTPAPASLVFSQNGQVLTSYTLSAETVTLTKAPVSTDHIYANYVVTTTGSTLAPYAETPSGAVNGINATFTLAHSPASNSLLFRYNGQVLYQGIGYTLSGNTVTLAKPPYTGESIYANYYF